MNHSPKPWTIGNDGVIYDANGERVPHIDATHCVNLHDELCNLLGEMSRWVETETPIGRKLKDRADALLSKAEGKS